MFCYQADLRIKLSSHSSDTSSHSSCLVALAGLSELMILNSRTSSAITVSQRVFSPNMLHILTPEKGTMVCIHSTFNSVLSQVELNECVQCEFSFINTGKFNFSFQAELSGPKSLLQYLEFSPTDGSVDVGQSAHASLSFQPLKKCVLKGLELKIKVRPFNIVQH